MPNFKLLYKNIIIGHKCEKVSLSQRLDAEKAQMKESAVIKFTLPDLDVQKNARIGVMMREKLKKIDKYNIKNVKVDYLFCSLSNFNLNSSVWVLYLGFKGMSLGQVGLLEGIFHITSFLFEVPTGAMADLIGRKRVLLLGRIFSIISTILLLTSNNFFLFAISFILSAASYNLNSGSEEALVYDSMKEAGKDEDYITVNGRLNFLIEVSQGAASFLGGVLSDISYTLTYICQMIKDVFAFFAGTLFDEPKCYEKEEILGVKEHALICYDILKNDRAVRLVLLYYPVVFSFHTLTFFYGQQHFANLGMSKTVIALLMLVSGVVCSISALCAKSFDRIFKEKAKYIATFIIAVSIFVFGHENKISSILCFLILNFANSLLYPISSNALNELIPSEQRATIISVNSMLFSMVMVVIFPSVFFLAVDS